MTRVVTNEDIKKYQPLINKFLRDSVTRNWNEARIKSRECDISLGNTGMSMADFRQYLLTELVVALQKYRPDFKTAEGKSVKESTFLYTHLSNRIGSVCKRLTKRRFAYGVWMTNIDDLTNGHHGDGE
jgi:hypothetical protein